MKRSKTLEGALAGWEKARKERLAAMTPEERTAEEKFQKAIAKSSKERADKLKKLTEKLSPEEKELRSLVIDTMREWWNLAWRRNVFRTTDDAGKWAGHVQNEARKAMRNIMEIVNNDENRIKKVLLPDEWGGGMLGGFKDFLERYRMRHKIVMVSVRIEPEKI